MKDMENEQIPKKIKKSIVKHLIVVFIVLIISIMYRENVTQIFTGTQRSMIPIGYNYFLLLYFLLIAITILLGMLVFYIMNKKDKRNVKNEERLKTFYVFYDISSFVLFTAIIITFFLAFIFSVTTVRGSSMDDTFQDGERVLVWHFNQSLRNNHVVVLHVAQYDRFLLKRIKATANDTLRFESNQNDDVIIDGNLFINDQLELVITYQEWQNITRNQEVTNYEMVIPRNSYFVLGDNRNNSIDSRNFGLAQRNEIVGTVIFRLSPLQRMGRPQANMI